MDKSDKASLQTITLDVLPIELSALLKFAGVAESGGEAKHMIREGLVAVNGEVELRKGRKLHPGDRVVIGQQTLVVSGS
ncbi:MAG: RNA-binding S4 domain-containing protein [Verrucomicrobiaceae bacterium]|nr:MAG: RNA-binding S4 domain-containing protein [Verrucomicrobiaceae bacterium]